MHRRQLLAALAASPLALSAFAAAAKPITLQPGVQLYTVREEFKRDSRGTLAKIAALGYKEVEFAGYNGHEPAELRRWLDELGLTAPSVHIDYKTDVDGLGKVIDDARVLGHQYVVVPWVDPSEWRDLDGWQRRADRFNRLGARCAEAGLQFCYHNHHFEFGLLGGERPYDILLARCDAKLVKMELDLFWAAVARQDLVALLRRDPDRFPLVHLKQAKALPWAAGIDPSTQNAATAHAVMTDVGPGVIDFVALLSDPAARGIKHGFVEHDVPVDEMGSLKASVEAMRGWRL
ncbi:MAG TPA: sugar phosphate isomerase/epimerase [Burkholderiaceae bacterium]|jgi:sugar phosphate isomerase/epimerase